MLFRSVSHLPRLRVVPGHEQRQGRLAGRGLSGEKLVQPGPAVLQEPSGKPALGQSFTGLSRRGHGKDLGAVLVRRRVGQALADDPRVDRVHCEFPHGLKALFLHFSDLRSPKLTAHKNGTG